MHELPGNGGEKKGESFGESLSPCTMTVRRAANKKPQKEKEL
jgi:hypothetical protein